MTESQIRTRYLAEYAFPGLLFPEMDTRDIEVPTLRAAVQANPRNGWYAVRITAITKELFTSDSGEERWLTKGGPEKVDHIVVGERIHINDIPDTPENSILRSNIRGNTDDGYAVKTRRGNWQFASDYNRVVSAETVDGMRA